MWKVASNALQPAIGVPGGDLGQEAVIPLLVVGGLGGCHPEPLQRAGSTPIHDSLLPVCSCSRKPYLTPPPPHPPPKDQRKSEARMYLQEDALWSAFCVFDKNGDGALPFLEGPSPLKAPKAGSRISLPDKLCNRNRFGIGRIHDPGPESAQPPVRQDLHGRVKASPGR